MSLTIFLEGGGRGKDLRTRCREGFHFFLGRLALHGRRPRLVACGSRADAFARFETALTTDPSGPYLLLVDTEECVDSSIAPWGHVAQRSGDHWQRPTAAKDDHLHFMAVCMESWLVADRDSLARFYGDGFSAGRLPDTTNLENVDKQTVMASLRAATRETKKGEYAKGKTSFAALAAIDVDVVREKMHYCDRLVRHLLSQ